MVAVESRKHDLIAEYLQYPDINVDAVDHAGYTALSRSLCLNDGRANAMLLKAGAEHSLAVHDAAAKNRGRCWCRSEHDSCEKKKPSMPKISAPLRLRLLQNAGKRRLQATN